MLIVFASVAGKSLGLGPKLTKLTLIADLPFVLVGEG